jgi:hypothetical protein
VRLSWSTHCWHFIRFEQCYKCELGTLTLCLKLCCIAWHADHINDGRTGLLPEPSRQSQQPVYLESGIAEQPADIHQQSSAESQSEASASAPASMQSYQTPLEARAVGHVTGAVYLFYMGGVGIAMTIVIIISLLSMQARSCGR